MSALNILVSSTRQWNPGDEFILFGVQNLLREAFSGDINWILYDRNPDRWINEWKLPLPKGADWSNVFRHYTLEGFDIAVIAGSPEWYGDPLKRFYSLVREYDIPLIVLGAGYNFGAPTAQFDPESGEATIDFSDDEIYCLRHLAQVVTTRDEYASRALSKVGVPHHVLPCPALFAADKESPPEEIRRVAFILQSPEGVQKIPEPMAQGALTAISELRAKGLELEIVFHYIDEFMEFLPILSPIRYSYDAREYLDILASFDLVISTRRLHGAILGNSLGKPAILISNGDTRSRSGAKLFPFIYVVQAGEVMAALDHIDVGDARNRLISWKLATRESYLRLLRPAAEKIAQRCGSGVPPRPSGATSGQPRAIRGKPDSGLPAAEFNDNLSSLAQMLASRASQMCAGRSILEQERAALELALRVQYAYARELGRRINDLEAHVRQLEARMQQIQRSIPMQLARRFQGALSKVAPVGTRRRRCVEVVLTGIRVILNEGWRGFFGEARAYLGSRRGMGKGKDE